MREHVQALPHDLKTAVLLFEYNQHSQEEIAIVLSCTPKAVETRLYRARKLLRDSLEIEVKSRGLRRRTQGASLRRAGRSSLARDFVANSLSTFSEKPPTASFSGVT